MSHKPFGGISCRHCKGQLKSYAIKVEKWQKKILRYLLYSEISFSDWNTAIPIPVINTKIQRSLTYRLLLTFNWFRPGIVVFCKNSWTTVLALFLQWCCGIPSVICETVFNNDKLLQSNTSSCNIVKTLLCLKINIDYIC